ncbi:hypothetical protein BKA69DRAFT_689965 [Paraphysoderma sedebokerense]|nr:hypothetical protein BKA69DRAFT_689965 [Paraphysoderma sedebokerense]
MITNICFFTYFYILNRTALHEAVSYRCMEVAHLLIRKGASKSAATALGETVTDIARKAGMSVDELDQLFAVTTDSPATPKQLEREAYIQEAIRLVLSSSPVNSSNVSENGLPFTRSSSPQPQPAKFHIRKRSDTVPVYLPSLTPSITPATLNSSNDAKNKNKEAKKKKNRRSTMSFGFSKKDATKNSTSDSDFTSSNSSGGKSIGGIDEVDEKGVESRESNKKTVKKSNSVTFSLFGSKEKG